MPNDPDPSPDWTMESVIKRLEEKTPPGQSVSAHVFLNDSVSAEEVPTAANQIVDAAKAFVEELSAPVEIGKVHCLAKSFSVKAPLSVIRKISTLGQVKSILPSDISDEMFIKPVKKTPAS
jgi:hypothetical protein